MLIYKAQRVLLKGFLTLSALAFALIAPAQTNTNSPYSRYGYGLLHEPLMGQSVGMGGVSYGLRSKNHINPMNPASYSAIDSMTFLMDVSFSAEAATLRENGVKEGNMGYHLEHVAVKIPLARNWGMALGLYEYSRLGYAYSRVGSLPGMSGEDRISCLESYSANGGLNNLFIGTSVQLFKCLSLGANWNYKFGTLNYIQSLTYPNSSLYAGMAVNDQLVLSQSNFDFGMQLRLPVSRKQEFILGATYTMDKLFRSEVSSVRVSRDTLTVDSNYDFGTPSRLGVGLSYIYDNRVVLALDYEQQGWSKVPFYSRRDTLASTRRLALGLEYLPARLGEHYFQVVKYRLGLHYSESYINFADGNLKDVGLSLGVGLPLKSQRSAVNLALEAGKTLTPSRTYIQENYYKLSVSVSFNETWFMKRKFN